MKLRTLRKPPPPKQVRCLDIQINDVLDFILLAIRQQNVQDLLNISLVSRRFYLLTVPHLYRELRFDFDRASHLRLLDRLERPGCTIPKMIRSLAFLNVNTKHKDKLAGIKKLIKALANIKEVEWHGRVWMLVCIIRTLQKRFPRARLTIRTLEKTPEGTAELSLNLWPVLFHPVAGRMVTHLDLILSEHAIFYSDFKEALVGMLSRSSVLTHLQIVAKTVLEQTFPRIEGLIRDQPLPKLRELRLYVKDSPMFSDDELRYWCQQGGFDQLTFLGLYHVHSLLTFIGRTPGLEELWLLPRQLQDIDILDSFLGGSVFKHPLGALRRLKVQLPFIHDIPSQNPRRMVPWSFLKLLPPDQLKALDISHPHDRVGHVQNVPTAQEIRDIRKICSALEELNIDVMLPQNPWPHDILKELAAFHKPITLTLIMRMGPPSRSLRYLREPRYVARHVFKDPFKLAKTIRSERERLQIPWQTPFVVRCTHRRRDPGIALVSMGAKLDHYLSYSFEIRSGLLSTYTKLSWRPDYERPREQLDKVSTEKLSKRKDEWFLNPLLRRDGKGYKDEFKRREDHRVLATMVERGHKVDITLYDYWMKAHSTPAIGS